MAKTSKLPEQKPLINSPSPCVREGRSLRRKNLCILMDKESWRRKPDPRTIVRLGRSGKNGWIQNIVQVEPGKKVHHKMRQVAPRGMWAEGWLAERRVAEGVTSGGTAVARNQHIAQGHGERLDVTERLGSSWASWLLFLMSYLGLEAIFPLGNKTKMYCFVSADVNELSGW